VRPTNPVPDMRLVAGYRQPTCIPKGLVRSRGRGWNSCAIATVDRVLGLNSEAQPRETILCPASGAA
jgi:hypothetical protein